MEKSTFIKELSLHGSDSKIRTFQTLLRNCKQSHCSDVSRVLIDAINKYKVLGSTCKNDPNQPEECSERKENLFQFQLVFQLNSKASAHLQKCLDFVLNNEDLKLRLNPSGGETRRGYLTDALIFILQRYWTHLKMSRKRDPDLDLASLNLGNAKPKTEVGRNGVSAVRRVGDRNPSANSWVPVHQEAIRKFSLAEDLMQNSLDLLLERGRGDRVDFRKELSNPKIPILSLKQRKQAKEALGCYMQVCPDDVRKMPGIERLLNENERVREGVDCDEVFPNLILGNGVTLKNKAYLKSIGITHILNAAEFRGVNIGEDSFQGQDDNYQYMGLRIEDKPQTQICRYFLEVADFIEDGLSSSYGKVFVNCVFGKSRSTTCIVAYLMLKQDMDALSALKRLRSHRDVELNEGFLTQIADLDHKIKWIKNKVKTQDDEETRSTNHTRVL